MAREDSHFKEGNAGGPGRPALPVDVKKARALNQIELQRILNEMLNYSREELKAKMADSSSSMLTLIVASILTNATNKGDPMRLNFILDRLVGKVKEQIEISNPYSGLPKTELIRLAEQEIQLLKEKNE